MNQSSPIVWVATIFLLASQQMYASDAEPKISADKINSDIQVSGPPDKSKGGIQDVISPANSKSEITTPAPGTKTSEPVKKASPTAKGSATSVERTKTPAVGHGEKPNTQTGHKPHTKETSGANSGDVKKPVANSSTTKKTEPASKASSTSSGSATSADGAKPPVGGHAPKPKTPVGHAQQGTTTPTVKTPPVNSSNTKTPATHKNTQAPTGRHGSDTRRIVPARQGHNDRRRGGVPNGHQGRAAAPIRENCSAFSPNHLAIVGSRRHWAVVDRAPLLHFTRRRSAQRAITVLRHYRMSKQCTIGYPKAVFRYYLTNSAAPRGYRLRGEHCASFSPVLLRLVRTRRGHWMLAEGRRYLFRFRYNRRDAIKALNVIQKYTFNHSCYVGHGRHVMRYLLQR